MAEQLVELGLAIGSADAIEFGLDGFQPHFVVSRVIEEGLPAVVALVDAEQAKCVANSWDCVSMEPMNSGIGRLRHIQSQCAPCPA